MKTRKRTTRSSSHRKVSKKTLDSPEPPPPRQRRKKVKKKRTRNKTTDNVNKWEAYRKTIHRLLLTLTRDEHFCNSLSMQRSSDSIVLLGELQHYGEKIRKTKKEIISLLEKLEAENSEHNRHETLAIPDENDMVDLESINCSKCGGVDTEDDDILFCDRNGCNRAYHQSCLDPPIQKDAMNFDDPDEDWFCWQCECLDDCIEMVNDMCNVDATSVIELFPELSGSVSSKQLSEGDDSDSDDDDYNSQCEDGSDGVDSLNGDDTDCRSTSDDDEDLEENVDEILAIDEEEVKYLMVEAGNEANMGTGGRQLRKRRGKNPILNLEQFSPGNVQIDQPVARVKQGYVMIGNIVEEVTQKKKVEGGVKEEKSWLVMFGDDSIYMKWDELRLCLLEYAQYEVDMERLNANAQVSSSTDVQDPHDECDPKNIVFGKRKTNRVDYAKLNEVLFGDESSELKSILDDSNDPDYKSKCAQSPDGSKKIDVSNHAISSNASPDQPPAFRTRKGKLRKIQNGNGGSTASNESSNSNKGNEKRSTKRKRHDEHLPKKSVATRRETSLLENKRSSEHSPTSKRMRSSVGGKDSKTLNRKLDVLGKYDYLIGTRHYDENFLYETTRMLSEKGKVVAYRKKVLRGGLLAKKEESQSLPASLLEKITMGSDS